MDDMVNLAQDFHRDLTLKDDQIHSLCQGIAGRDTTIRHLEVQILEGDAQILQRNTVIDFLQEQVHDLNQELGDTLGHIERLQVWQNQPELYRLKYASPLQRAPTCFKRYNPLACRVMSR
jgi:hypothetical protein